MWKKIRIAILFLILLSVIQQNWLSQKKAVEWNDPLRITIYPINADGSDAANNYISKLNVNDFAAIEKFLAEEAKRHGVSVFQAARVSLASPVNQLPPSISDNPSTVSIILWSLKVRYWAWRVKDKSSRPQINLFVLYFDQQQNSILPHSTGLQKGKIGIINAYASTTNDGRNSVVIAHELLHTIGATDKYDRSNLQPIYPEGYAEPELQPRFPQNFAEIMGGRVPITGSEARIPDGLSTTLVGTKTAEEIGWIKIKQ